MILMSVRFLANRHILLVIGDLQEIRIRRQKGDFSPKWSFAIASKTKNYPPATTVKVTTRPVVENAAGVPAPVYLNV